MNKQNQLAEIHHSGESYIIYKSKKGFDLYTDFSKKIILTNHNIKNFINKATQFKFKKKETDLYVGFFGYEILNNLIRVNIKKQKGFINPGIYKGSTMIFDTFEDYINDIKNDDDRSTLYGINKILQSKND